MAKESLDIPNNMREVRVLLASLRDLTWPNLLTSVCRVAGTSVRRILAAKEL